MIIDDYKKKFREQATGQQKPKAPGQSFPSHFSFQSLVQPITPPRSFNPIAPSGRSGPNASFAPNV